MSVDISGSINVQYHGKETQSWSGNHCCRRQHRRQRRQPRRMTLPLACIEEEEMSSASGSSNSQKDISEQESSALSPRGLKRTDRRTVCRRRVVGETSKSPASPSSTLQDPFCAMFKADGASGSSTESTEPLRYLPQKLRDAVYPLPFVDEDEPQKDEDVPSKCPQNSRIKGLESLGFSWNSPQLQHKKVTFSDTLTFSPMPSELAEKCRRHSLVF